MKKRLRILALLLIAAGIGIYLFYVKPGEKSSNVLTIYGNIDIRETQLAFQSTGRIAHIDVTEGNVVDSGQLLAELDPARYRAAAAQAKAQVAAQKQVVAELMTGSRPEEIAAAKARVAAARASLEDARQSYNRIEALAKTKFVSRQQFDTASAALKSARANLDAEQQALELAVQGPRQEKIDAAKATLDAYQASLDLAETELADTRLYAPAPGIIRNRILEPGDMAFPQNPVLTLALIDPLWVRAYLDEPDLGRVAPGMLAEVTTDSYPGKIYNGWIGYISPTAEFTPKTVETTELRSRLVYQVRVFVCNPENELRLGMPVTVNIRLDQPRSARLPENPCGKNGDK